VDLDGDGRIDVLSGSYSRRQKDMAGLFQVLWGQKDGSFRPAEVLNGTDGQPLIIPASKELDADKICTRPFAADLDGDGKLDLVVGNFRGTFAFFRGEGGGRFAPQPSWLKGLEVEGHSDPCVVDWDGDGLLDIVSGSDGGGVLWFKNVGSRTEPRFAARQTLLPAVDSRSVQVTISGEELQDSETRLGDAHVTKPGRFTRVWVDDVNGDGKLDVLVGDFWDLTLPAPGIDLATARQRLTAWEKEQTRVELHFENGRMVRAVPAKDDKAQKERDKIVRDVGTGFVWVLYGK
jgi:hypothetical protein